jgi:hypothetical protein
MAKEIISCVCLTCGIRNNHTHPDGLCQNDHDDWLEYRDVVQMNYHFKRALKLFDLTADDFTSQFMNNEIKQFVIKNQPKRKRNVKT